MIRRGATADFDASDVPSRLYPVILSSVLRPVQPRDQPNRFTCFLSRTKYLAFFPRGFRRIQELRVPARNPELLALGRKQREDVVDLCSRQNSAS